MRILNYPHPYFMYFYVASHSGAFDKFIQNLFKFQNEKIKKRWKINSLIDRILLFQYFYNDLKSRILNIVKTHL